MSFYATDFNKIRQDKTTATILEALERAFNKFGIDYYLVGAIARDVWMRGIHNITPRRASSDLDFGVMVQDNNQFEELKKYLIEKEGFLQSPENAFKLIYPSHREIDIVPFGAIEKEGRVSVKGTGMTSISMPGFKEVYEAGAENVTFEKRFTFKVSTLPGIVVLKLIAWDDRPEMRTDDIHDIADIMKHFFNIYDETIWAEHNDLFRDDADLDLISAQVLGREMGKILMRNTGLKDRVLEILTRDNKVASLIAASRDMELDKTTDIINSLVKGIQEEE